MKCTGRAWAITIIASVLVLGSIAASGLASVNLINVVILASAISMMYFEKNANYRNAATACMVIMWTAVVTAVFNAILFVVVAMSDPREKDHKSHRAHDAIVAVLATSVILQLLFVYLAHNTNKCFLTESA